MPPRLVICDGIVGSGKSSTAEFLARYLRSRGVPVRLVGEDGPLRLHALHRPPRTSIPPEYVPSEPVEPAAKPRITPEAFARESLKRWAVLAQEAAASDELLVADGHVFHGAADQLLFLDAPSALIEAYVAQIFACTAPLKPILVHLVRPDLPRALAGAARERGPAWTRHQVDWKVVSPYGARRGYDGFDGLARLFCDLDRLSGRAAGALPNVVRADVSGGRYDACYREVLGRLGLPADGPLGIAGVAEDGDLVLMGEADGRDPAPVPRDVPGSVVLRQWSSADGLAGLRAVATIGGHLRLIGTEGVRGLAALSGVRAIAGGIACTGNASLETVDLPALERVGGSVAINGNPCLRRVENLGAPEELEHLRVIANPSLTELCGPGGLRSVAGHVALSANDRLERLDGLRGLRRVGKDLELSYNGALTDLRGLEGLEEIGGTLKIIQNHGLRDLGRLRRLGSVRAVCILENPDLSGDAIEGFLDALRSRGFSGPVTVARNGPDYDPAVERKWRPVQAG